MLNNEVKRLKMKKFKFENSKKKKKQKQILKLDTYRRITHKSRLCDYLGVTTVCILPIGFSVLLP